MAHIVRPFDMSKPFKLELGSGPFPQPGYIHVDVNEPNPELDIVCCMGDEALPVPDGSVSELLSNHSIEHISWLKIDLLLKDWFRVLIPGGRLFLRTPDLEFICRVYLHGQTTPEHPVDVGSMSRIFGQCGPSEWANIKLFAGQNYPGNFHFVCFDFPMLKRALERYGFERVTRLQLERAFSPGEIQAEAFKSFRQS